MKPIHICRLEIAVFSEEKLKDINRQREINFTRNKNVYFTPEDDILDLRIAIPNENAFDPKPKGVRRTIEITIKDLKLRKEVFCRKFNVSISKSEYIHFHNIYICRKEMEWIPDHSFEIEFFNLTQGHLLGTYSFYFKPKVSWEMEWKNPGEFLETKFMQWLVESVN